MLEIHFLYKVAFNAAAGLAFNCEKGDMRI
jgi:hypothetical protein